MYKKQEFTVPTASQVFTYLSLAIPEPKGHVTQYCYTWSAKVEAMANHIHHLFTTMASQTRDASKVFFTVDKQPRNLDSGPHWYGLYFINSEGCVERFWPASGEAEFVKWLGIDTNNRDTSRPKYGFKSSAIGMSRLLDATDYFCHRLSEILVRCGCVEGIDPNTERTPNLLQFSSSDIL